MTNHHTKLEDHWAMSSLVIDWIRFVYGPTDRPTCAKQYTPSSLKGGGGIIMSMIILPEKRAKCTRRVNLKSVVFTKILKFGFQ